MSEYESHDIAGGTKEMVTSLSNVFDVDVSIVHKLNSMLLNEFNYLP
jgi:hypothetical protein